MINSIADYTSSTDRELLVKVFNDKGYLILRKVLDVGDLELIKEKVLADSKLESSWREKFAAGKLSVREVSNVYPQVPLIQEVLQKSFALSVVEAIIAQPLYLFRDAFIVKMPNPNSRFPMHQDSEFWKISPEKLVSMWIPFQETNSSNGVLAVVPGSHKERYTHVVKFGKHISLPQIVNKILRQSAKNASAKEVVPTLSQKIKSSIIGFINNKFFPFLSRHFTAFEKFTELFVVDKEALFWKKAILSDVKPGDLIIYHSLTLHGSQGNNTPGARVAYIPTFMGADFTRDGVRVSEPEMGYASVKPTLKN